MHTVVPEYADDIGEFEISSVGESFAYVERAKRGSAEDWLCGEPYRVGHACFALG